MELPVFIILLLLLVGAIYFGAKYLEKKEIKEIKKEVKREIQSGKAKEKEVVVYQDGGEQAPYATSPIMDVDDYEYSMVFQNEGDRSITKAQRDRLMSQYPMDWSTQPPSSAQFQKGLEAFENEQKEKMGKPEFTVDYYKEVDGSNMIPPDKLELEHKEREILATYKPKDPESLKTYDAADAKEIIKKIYDSKGEVAQYMEERPGVFVILDTYKKNREIEWEDDVNKPEQAPATKDANQKAGENTIVVPPAAYDYSSGLDPFFTPGAKTRDGKWDYTSWTPGLERMFAPNEPRTNWY
jgi:hypothetical protein